MNGLELREVAQSCFPTLRQLVLILRAVSRTPCLLCKPQFLRLQHSDSYSFPGMSKHTAQHVPYMKFLYHVSVLLPMWAFGCRRFETSWTLPVLTMRCYLENVGKRVSKNATSYLLVRIFFMFIGPCIVIYFYSKTKYMHQFLTFIYF